MMLPFSIVWGLAVTLLFLLAPAQAMRSYDCVEAAMNGDLPKLKGQCPKAVCGELEVPDESSSPEAKSFLKRMSPQCQDIMRKYRRQDLGAQLGIQFDTGDPTQRSMKGGKRGPCPETRGATTPTNPVVVQAEGVHSFVICTVPKSGCTNLRKLMHAVINSGKETSIRDLSVPGNPHQHDYATLWHFEHSHVPADVYPSFIVGRNPYIRLLSGFLDKMIHNKDRIDQTTGQLMNEDLGLDSEHRWDSEVEEFHRFVHQLASRGTEGVNIHFTTQLSVCARNTAAVEFEYYLRIEDLAQWFPCWDEGLGLSKFTSEGWAVLPHGKVYVGTDFTQREQLRLTPECWWYPPGTESCEDYYSATHSAAADGVVQAVPWEEKVAVTKVRKNDEHDTAAAKRWTSFYTQEIGDIVYKLFERDFKAFGYTRETF